MWTEVTIGCWKSIFHLGTGLEGAPSQADGPGDRKFGTNPLSSVSGHLGFQPRSKRHELPQRPPERSPLGRRPMIRLQARRLPLRHVRQRLALSRTYSCRVAFSGDAGAARAFPLTPSAVVKRRNLTPPKQYKSMR